MIQPHKDMKKIKKKYSLEIKKKILQGVPKKKIKFLTLNSGLAQIFFDPKPCKEG